MYLMRLIAISSLPTILPFIPVDMRIRYLASDASLYYVAAKQ